MFQVQVALVIPSGEHTGLELNQCSNSHRDDTSHVKKDAGHACLHEKDLIGHGLHALEHVRVASAKHATRHGDARPDED